MKLDVIVTAQEVTDKLVNGKTAVIIDVLRATSVMITALDNGMSEVIPVLTPNDAFTTKQELGSTCILGGERNAEPIEGFDFGNSPLSYNHQSLVGKTLVMTTTNGTLAIKSTMKAKELLVASFINDIAMAKYLSSKSEVVLVCSGNNGLYTLEDALCAGRIIHLIKQHINEVHLSDLGFSIEQLYTNIASDMISFAQKGLHYQVLQAKGYDADLEYCFRSGISSIIPIWNGKSLIKK